MLGLVLAAASLAVAGSPRDGVTEAEAPAMPRSPANWGVQVLSVRLSAAGHVVDFRYRVTDAEKAASLFERRAKPYLIDHRKGIRLAVQSTGKTGPLRSTNIPKNGKDYVILFANPVGAVEARDPVSIVIGEFTTPLLVVE